MDFLARISLATVVALLVLPMPARAQAGDADALDLRDAIAEALQHSPQLSPSDDAAEAAAIQRELARSQYRPTVTPSLNTASAPSGLSQQGLGLAVSQQLPTGGRVQASVSSMRYGSGETALHDASYTFGISQPILAAFGPGARAEVKTAERAVDSATRRLADARQRLVVSAAQAYYAVVRQRRGVELGDRALERAVTLVEMSEARARVGLSTQLDVLRAKLLESQARAGLLRDRDGLEGASEDLNVLLGRRPDSPIAVVGDLAADLRTLEQATGRSADAPVAATGTLADDALRDRLDVRNARAQLADARWNVSVANWNLLPQMNLDVSYTGHGIGSSAGAFAGFPNGWRVGVSTTYSLDRGQAAAAAALADIGIRQAEREVTDTEERAVADVRAAARSISRAAGAVELQQSALQLATEQRELATLRYERGLADNLEVIDAETTVFQAETALLGAEVDRILAFVSLERAAGTLNPDRFLQ